MKTLATGSVITADVGGVKWTDNCPTASEYMPNTEEPNALNLAFSGVAGVGVVRRPVKVPADGLLEKLTLTGNIRGRRGCGVKVRLLKGDREPLTLLDKTIDADLVNPIVVGDTVEVSYANAISLPTVSGETYALPGLGQGWVFDGYIGKVETREVVLPQGEEPVKDLFEHASVIEVIPGSPPYETDPIPAHRPPWAGDQIWVFPAEYRYYDERWSTGLYELDSSALKDYPPFFRGGYKYRFVRDEGVTTSRDIDVGGGDIEANYQGSTYSSVTVWDNLLNPSGSRDNNADQAEAFYKKYNAHYWHTIGVRTETYRVPGVSPTTKTTTIVRLFRRPDVVWEVTELPRVRWRISSSPMLRFRFVDLDAAEHFALGDRYESFTLEDRSWQRQAIEGVWDMEVTLTEPALPQMENYTIVPARPRIEGLNLKLESLRNAPYWNDSVVTTSTGADGSTHKTVTGYLMASREQRSMVGLLLGMGSNNRGVLGAYLVDRIGTEGSMYSVAFVVAEVCDVLHLHRMNIVDRVIFENLDWGGSHTDGARGESHALSAEDHRRWPIRGQIQIRAEISGTRAVFRLLGSDSFPPLAYRDVTVLDVTNYRRISRNA